MEDKEKNLELAETRDAIELVPTWDLPLWWILVAVAVMAAIVLLVMILLRKKKPKVDAALEKSEAYREAKTAFSGSDDKEPRETAIRVSMILRRYLARSMHEPALFETHEEFIARHDGLKSLPDDVRSEVSAFFSKLAAVKYAPYEICDTETHETSAEGVALLERIHCV